MVWWFFCSLGLNKAITFCSCFRSLQGPLLKVQSAAKLVGGFCVLKARCPSSSQVNRHVKWAVRLPAARTEFLCSKCMVRKCLNWDVLDVKKKVIDKNVSRSFTFMSGLFGTYSLVGFVNKHMPPHTLWYNALQKDLTDSWHSRFVTGLKVTHLYLATSP